MLKYLRALRVEVMIINCPPNPDRVAERGPANDAADLEKLGSREEIQKALTEMHPRHAAMVRSCLEMERLRRVRQKSERRGAR